MKLEKELTQDQINKIGQVCFPFTKEWEIYPPEKFSPENRWNGIDLVPKGQKPHDENITCIQINLKDDLDLALSFDFMDVDGGIYGLNGEMCNKIKAILEVK